MLISKRQCITDLIWRTKEKKFKIIVQSLSDQFQQTCEYQYKNYSPIWNNMKSVLAKVLIFNKMLQFGHRCVISKMINHVCKHRAKTRHNTVAVCLRSIYVLCCNVVNVLQVVLVNKIVKFYLSNLIWLIVCKWGYYIQVIQLKIKSREYTNKQTLNLNTWNDASRTLLIVFTWIESKYIRN